MMILIPRGSFTYGHLSYFSSFIYNINILANNVFKIWKDVTKDAGGLGSKYHYPLPWNPMRSAGESGKYALTQHQNKE